MTDEELINAIEQHQFGTVARAYQGAAEAANSLDAAAFYATQALVYAMQAGLAEIEEKSAQLLRSAGRLR